jgi:hypothetical protein
MSVTRKTKRGPAKTTKEDMKITKNLEIYKKRNKNQQHSRPTNSKSKRQNDYFQNKVSL